MEHLGSDKPSVRQGGTHALFHLALKDKGLRASIAGILCAHIRETTSNKDYQEQNKNKPSTEMQSLLRLLFVAETADEESLARFWQGSTPDLNGGYFCGVELEGARFQGAKLSSAQFKGAKLIDAWFQEAKLDKAQFQRAWIRDAKFQGAWMREARFHVADIRQAQFKGRTLRWPSSKERGSLGPNSKGHCFGRPDYSKRDWGKSTRRFPPKAIRQRI